MSTREEQIEAEAAALWRELYDEAPPKGSDGGDLLETLLRRLPAVGYERLNSPFLRRPSVSWPKRGR
jgi:hypothetical protein